MRYSDPNEEARRLSLGSTALLEVCQSVNCQSINGEFERLQGDTADSLKKHL